MRFLLLHDQKMDENLIKAFMYELYELYLKVCLNPFYDRATPITSRTFDERVRALGAKFIGWRGPDSGV